MIKPLTIANTNDIDTTPEKFIIGEQVRRPVEKEKKIDEKIFLKFIKKNLKIKNDYCWRTPLKETL